MRAIPVVIEGVWRLRNMREINQLRMNLYESTEVSVRYGHILCDGSGRERRSGFTLYVIYEGCLMCTRIGR